MNISGLVRLTKDSEIAATPSGKPVLKINAAFDTGYGEHKKTTWVDASFWGDRGIKLAPYLLKGTQICLHGDSVEADAYQGKNGLSTKLRMNVVNIELVARNNSDGANSGAKTHTQQHGYIAQQSSIPQGVQVSPNASLPNANDFLDEDLPF